MKSFVDEHRSRLGVEPICKALQVAPSAYRRHAARARDPGLLSARAQHDAVLLPHIERVWQANLQVYSADKVWRQLYREGVTVARCTVERLMRRQGLRGRHAATRSSISKSAAVLQSADRETRRRGFREAGVEKRGCRFRAAYAQKRSTQGRTSISHDQTLRGCASRWT